MQTSNCGVSYQTFPLNKMDYHKKMILTPTEQKVKIEEDDDEDLEALRLAALQSLRTKETINKKSSTHTQPVISHITQTSRFPYKNQRRGRGTFYHNRSHPRQVQNYNHPYQNGNVYYQSPRNPNLIAIVPVEEDTVPRRTELPCSVNIEKTDPCSDTKTPEITKFHRFNDNGSGSEDEDAKEQKNTTEDAGKTESAATINTETDKDIAVDDNAEKTEEEEDSQKNQEDDEEDNDDDADILLMADLEEEDSLERLMDEMEREMNVDKPSEQKQAKASKKEHRESRKYNEQSLKNQEQKIKTDEVSNKRFTNSSTSLTSTIKSERRSISPHKTNILQQKRRSLSPKTRSRKKSPRRSPRRSPPRQAKKQPRETTRYKSPRKSPPRYPPRSRSPRLSPRPRSPRLSPRRSPNRSPIRRSPLRKLSPRGRSPRLSPHARSPKRLRSRTPPVMSRSKSPRPPRSPKVLSRSRSPRLRSRSPRYSPVRRSRSKSPRGSPRRGTPPRRLSPRRSPPSRRLSPRLRSPVLSPRRTSPRGRTPKLSPRRVSPRLRSPRPSPRRSPWSSPRNSPRLSPRRKRSPQWSPKELSRKRTTRSISPDASNLFARDKSPVVKGKSSPETSRQKLKQREEQPQRNTSAENIKEHIEITNNPILEARRKKFECTKPIDLVVANKKIKLSKKENVKKTESVEDTDLTSNNPKKSGKPVEDYDTQETDLCLDVNYEFEDLDDSMENTSPIGIPSTVSIEVEPTKADKEKKKKRKRDKEIYQVGKLKGELPLSERIGKEKKATKRKDVSETSSEDVEAIFEDLAVDEEGDLRTELSRRRAERLHRTVPLQSARLVQSAFKGVVNEVVKNNAKVNQRHMIKSDDKSNQKGIRRVTVLHRTVSDLHDSEDESAVDSKVPVRFRLGLNKQVQETRESKVSRKASKRQGRKVKHKNLSSDPQHTL